MEGDPLIKRDVQCKDLLIEAMRFHLIPERQSHGKIETISNGEERQMIGSSLIDREGGNICTFVWEMSDDEIRGDERVSEIES